MRELAFALVLAVLAGCDDTHTDEFDPGLFEPWMFNDVAYYVTYVSATPIEDASLLAQGFVATREIRITRMTDPPFGSGDAAEAAEVAADFCSGGTQTFVPGAAGIFDDSAGFLFPRSCFQRQS